MGLEIWYWYSMSILILFEEPPSRRIHPPPGTPTPIAMLANRLNTKTLSLAAPRHHHVCLNRHITPSPPSLVPVPKSLIPTGPSSNSIQSRLLAIRTLDSLIRIRSSLRAHGFLAVPKPLPSRTAARAECPKEHRREGAGYS